MAALEKCRNDWKMTYELILSVSIAVHQVMNLEIVAGSMKFTFLSIVGIIMCTYWTCSVGMSQ